MNVRIIRKGTDCYLQLPQEFSQIEEAEIFKLKDGYYLISLPLGKPVQEKPVQEKQVQSGVPNSEEKEVLRKLGAIKFENRTPKHITQSFSSNEKTMLSQMEKKGFVQLYKGGKYKDGVYSIPDKVYPLLKENPANPAIAQAKPISPLDPFFKQGFVVFSNNNEAADFSELLKKTGNSLNILGIKGFDGKFYVVTKDYMIDLSGKIRAILKGNNTMTSPMIAKACNADDSGCRAVLLLMAEKGDVLEKKKDVFILV